MATRWEIALEGYDVSRFVDEVREDLLCSICQEVPKDPRLCSNKDHFFCFSHISRHLHQNSQTCPVCRDPLTLETLRCPTGFLKNYLDDLKIKCDHHDRGCPDVVRLEDLPRHVDQCGFAPVMCGNEGCGMVVNNRDKDNHEKNLCQFRNTKCHNCKGIKGTQDEMKAIQDEMKAGQDEIKVNINEVKDFQVEFQSRQEYINVKVNEMKQSVDEIKRQFQTMMTTLNQVLQRSNANNNGPQIADAQITANNLEIIIIGGWYGPAKQEISNTVEKFNIAEGKSTDLPRMNFPRAASASCVHNNDVIVTGGHDGQAATDLIEILTMTQQPLRWTLFDGKLPVKLSYHVVVVYQEKLYVIGGYSRSEKKTSDAIYEISLVQPYTSKLLARMPEPRLNHGAELVNNKLFILGGSTTGFSKDAIDSVLAYDFITNECTPQEPLPKPVSKMSAVTCGNAIVVIGGADTNSQDLNDVIMYDTESGKSEKLPSLKHKRCDSSAVVMDDVIVVLGGRSDGQGCLNSIEKFTMGDDEWRELPGMKEKRNFASAVVKPNN